MKTLDYSKLAKAQEEKFNFDYGKYLNDAFKIFSAQWLNFCMYSLVCVFIIMLSAITLIGPYILMYPLLMGYLVVAEKIENNEHVEFNDFFSGMKNYGQYFIYMLITLACSLLLFIPLSIWMISIGLFNESLDDEATAALILGSFYIILPFIFIGSMLIQIFLFLAPYLIHYGNMNATDAVKTSFKIAKKNIGYLFLFILIMGLISSLGVVACYIGMLASYPIGYLMAYSFLKDFLLTDESEIDLIGKHEEK